VAGVATATAVLAGSLLVGESVKASLKRLALERLGRTAFVVESPRFFREGLAEELGTRPSFAPVFADACPILALQGVVTHQESGRHAGDVLVYGVDDRFFVFQGLDPPRGLEGRGALASETLGAELGAKEGDTLLVRLPPASAIPGSSLFGRRDEPGQRIRVTAKGVLPRSGMGELALRPTQHEVRALFVPLALAQRTLGIAGRANALLVSQRGSDASFDRRGTAPPHSLSTVRFADASEAELATQVAASVRLPDLGLRLRKLHDKSGLALESESALLDDATVEIASRVARVQELEPHSVVIYLANAIGANGREVPYSLVAGLDESALATLARANAAKDVGSASPLWLNDWAAVDLGAKTADAVTLEYYLWHEEGRLLTRSSTFTVAGIVAMRGLAADPDLVPEYPGITESVHLSDWDPPFPVDLSRLRPKDEAYWDRWRTTPKAFLPLAVAQELWGSRLGRVTSLRLRPSGDEPLEVAAERFEDALRVALMESHPAGPQGREAEVADSRLRALGLRLVPVRANALEAAQGATDFGEYFVYFSFFLVGAALLLTGLFFRLGVEQRVREVGLLRAVGFTPSRIRRHLLNEGIALATLGAAAGMVAAALYAGLIMLGLRTVWAGAVGTRGLELSVSPMALAIGAVGGVIVALLTIVWTLRGLGRRSPRALLAGSLGDWVPPRKGRRRALPLLVGTAAFVLVLASMRGLVYPVTGFFGSGGLLLGALLLGVAEALRSRPRKAAAIRSVVGLGLRAVTFRPGRSVLCVALVAAAAFVIAAVGAFRREGAVDLRGRDSETGGFTLLATSLLPLHHDPRTAEGRAALGLPEGDDLAGVEITRFRRRSGEDVSCLNLYRPGQPTVLGATRDFLREGRFAFQASIAETAEELANPWLLLEGKAEEGAIPVVADGVSLAHVLHKKLGDVMRLGETGLQVRFVAALRPGLLQGELLTSEEHLLEAFPDEEGYRFFLIEAPPGREEAVAQALESRLSDFGFDVTDAAQRLAAYHRVENTYIATFQTLGALGLLLGTLGLAIVLARNALERRRELALLRAVGYTAVHLRTMVLGENAVLVVLGLLAGVVPALIAITPALRERGGGAPLVPLLSLVVGVLFAGALASSVGVAVVRRLPLLSSLRSE
jgi:hypothetical protein